jgi:hypothetical protein
MALRQRRPVRPFSSQINSLQKALSVAAMVAEHFQRISAKKSWRVMDSSAGFSAPDM